MKRGKEFRTRLLFLSSHLNYLPESDRYLLALETPKYKFNVLGTGLMGQEHIKVTLFEGRATIHGVFDPNPRSIEAAKQIVSQHSPDGNVTVYEALEPACHDPEVDGLIICTPNHTHIDIVREAIKSGKHVLLEKPMATNLRDGYEIVRLADNHDAVFQIGMQYRYKPVYREAIYEALDRKSIGEIKSIGILEHRIPFQDKVGQWNKFTQYSGGTLVEKCCHYFDLMNLFAQAKPATVYASGGMAVNFDHFEHDHEKSDILDNAFVIVVYENGIRANFSLCMFSPMFYEELILCGDEGRLRTVEQEDFRRGERLKTQLEILCGETQASRTTTPGYPVPIEESGHNGSTFYEHVQFIDNIEKKQTSTATTEEGYWAIVVGIAAEESIKTGLVVNIAELLESVG